MSYIRTPSASELVFTQIIHQDLAQYINCTAKGKKKKKEKKQARSQGGPVMNTSCVNSSSSYSLLLFSLLWAVIDLISSSLNWSHDSCCSDWPSLTAHRHSSVMPFAIYLSICLCLLSLSLPSGESTCCSYRATITPLLAPCAIVFTPNYFQYESLYISSRGDICNQH